MVVRGALIRFLSGMKIPVAENGNKFKYQMFFSSLTFGVSIIEGIWDATEYRWGPMKSHDKKTAPKICSCKNILYYTPIVRLPLVIYNLFYFAWGIISVSSCHKLLYNTPSQNMVAQKIIIINFYLGSYVCWSAGAGWLRTAGWPGELQRFQHVQACAKRFSFSWACWAPQGMFSREGLKQARPRLHHVANILLDRASHQRSPKSRGGEEHCTRGRNYEVPRHWDWIGSGQ